MTASLKLKPYGVAYMEIQVYKRRENEAVFISKKESCGDKLMVSIMDKISSIFDDLHVSDDLYAELLQLQEVLVDSLSTPSHASPSSLSLSKICCQICTNDKEADEMFQIHGCSHSFCSDCISRHVQSKLQSNIINISCLSEDCENMIELESVKSIVPSSVIANWGHRLSEMSVLPSERYYCPYTYCNVLLINEDDDEGGVMTESECPSCRRNVCAQCKVPWHEGLSCEEFQGVEEEKEDELRLLAEENNWQLCPGCGATVERTEGCIHMVCWCKYEFCYICGEDWSESHFNTCQELQE